MESEIRPEPSPEEREAIRLALAQLLAEDARPPGYRSAWREVGVRENLEAPLDDEA